MTTNTTFLFANNAQSTVAVAVDSADTTVTLAAGAGALFPSPGTRERFGLTFVDAATGLLTEICYCTSRTGDVLTILRAQEGTTAQDWAVGDFAANFWTAGQGAVMAQPVALQAQAGNYGDDGTGVADAYVVALDPVVAAYTNGLTFRWRVPATNTGASTLNAGPGVKALRRNDNTALQAADLVVGQLVTVTYDTSLDTFQVNGPVSSQGGGVGPASLLYIGCF